MGKRCEFLTQELGRESNTIGSKCRDSDMSAQVVTAKVEPRTNQRAGTQHCVKVCSSS